MREREGEAGRIDALRIGVGGEVLTLATQHDGLIEIGISGDRVVLDGPAVIHVVDWLISHNPEGHVDPPTEPESGQ